MAFANCDGLHIRFPASTLYIQKSPFKTHPKIVLSRIDLSEA